MSEVLDIPPQAVIFDMDGVLLDTERLARLSWQDAAREFGYELSDEVFCRLVGRRSDESKKELEAVFGREFPFEQVRKRRLEWGQRHIAQKGIDVKDGAVELLEMLKEAGAPCAVGTSTDTNVAKKQLEQANLLSYFKALVGRDQVARVKPAPDIFLFAADELGVSAEDCLVLEDSELGTQAAVAAGMRVFFIRDLLAPTAEVLRVACGVFASLHEVKPVLERWW